MTIQSDIESRITQAADKLYEEAGRDKFPTVDAVRRAARADMNTTTLVMKAWRRQQTVQPEAVRSTVPEPLRNEWLGHHENALVSLWESAQALANEALESAQAAWEIERQEAEKLLAEASQAYDDQTVQLDKEMAGHKAAVERADTAEQRVTALEQELKDTQAEAKSENMRLQGLITGLEGQLENAKTVEKNASKNANKVQDKLDDANHQWATTKGELQNAENTIKSLRSDLNKANKDLEQKRNENSNLRKKADIAHQLADDRKEVLDNNYKAHNKALDDLRDDFKSRIQYLEEDAREAKKSLVECRNELSESKRYIDKSKSLDDMISSLEKENSKLKGKDRSGLSK